MHKVFIAHTITRVHRTHTRAYFLFLLRGLGLATNKKSRNVTWTSPLLAYQWLYYKKKNFMRAYTLGNMAYNQVLLFAGLSFTTHGIQSSSNTILNLDLLVQKQSCLFKKLEKCMLIIQQHTLPMLTQTLTIKMSAIYIT